MDKRTPTDKTKKPRRSPLTSVKRIQKSHEVRRQIERAIDRGDFVASERLPSERELVEMLGVSRVSVREALSSLEAIGLIEIHQGRGCFVADGRSGYLDPAARWLAHHKDEVLDLLGVRGALEEFAVRSAVERRHERQLERIVAVEREFATAAAADEQDTARLVELDIEFHDAIAEASGNRLLRDLLRDLNDYLGESRHAALAPVGRPAKSATEHAAIVDAIEARDAQVASAALARHIDSVRLTIVAALAGQKKLTSGGTGRRRYELEDRQQARVSVDAAAAAH